MIDENNLLLLLILRSWCENLSLISVDGPCLVCAVGRFGF